MNLKTRAIPGALFAVTVWGASFVATKLALRDVSPATVVWLRFSMGAAILWLAVALRRQFAFPEQRLLGLYALLGFLGITFHQWLQATGLQTAQATTTSWIVATSPVFMALLGWLVLRERLTRLQTAGILLAFIGVLLVVTNGDLSKLFGSNFVTLGDFLILISSLNWAVFSAISRRGLQRATTGSATLMMAYVMTFGWLYNTAWFLSGPGPSQIADLSRAGWTGVLFLGIFCSGLAYIFWYDALQALPVAQTGAFLYIEPFVTLLVAAAILGERITLASLLGGGTILLGVWMVQRKRSG